MPAEAPRVAAPQGAATSLFNGLRVLEAFSIDAPVMGVTEISARVGLHKSTVSRTLAGLAEAGYVQRDEESGRYRLGLRIIALAGPLLADLDVRRAAAPHLEEAVAATGETCALAVWNGREAVVVEQVASPHQVKHTAAIGTRYNRWGSSSVRVHLAELTDAEVEALVADGSVLNAPERTARQRREHLAGVRAAGYAVNAGWTTPEEFGVAAPVRDYRDGVVGCVVLSAPASRVPEAVASELVAVTRDTAARVSARLGRAG